jgi:5-methylcytosine-specific restriction endonuclease McrA
MFLFNKLELSTRGNNYKTLHKYINKYNIDISHFNANFVRGEKLQKFNKIPIEEILVENSTYTWTSNLKNRLYDEGLKERKCEKCGQGELWLGEKISLIIDHINGINNDNRFSNLRILCPNCNAALSTHCGKNRKSSKLNIIKNK